MTDKVLQHILYPGRILGYVEFENGEKGWWFDSSWKWKAVLNHGHCQNINVILL